VAADTAADLLAQRFAAPGSCGIQQLLVSCDAASLGTYTSTHQQQQQQHSRSWIVMPPLTADQVEEAAQQLASIPDRVQQLPEVPALLQPACFVQQVLQQALLFISSSTQSSSSSSSGGGGGDSDSSGNAPAVQRLPGAAALVARLMQKLLTRGHARHVAAALLQMVLGSPAATAAAEPAAAAADGSAAAADGSAEAPGLVLAMQLVLLQLSSHSAAAEKLLVHLLRQACTHNTQQHQTRNSNQVSEPLQNQQQQLKVLLCPLLVLDANFRSIATHRLLLGRTLPASSLQLLLNVLASCQPSLIPAAAVGLAQGWADQHTCQNVSVQQQAYMTAALAACMELLPRDVLDPAAAAGAAAAAAAGSSSGKQQFSSAALAAAHLAAVKSAADTQLAAAAAAPYEGEALQQVGTLVPSILQGVSMRLASPSPAIRAQAMRVGRGCAAKLDPAKPLFEEAGELQLLADELWPGAHDYAALPQLQQQAVPQHGKQSNGGNVSGAAADAANGTLESDSSSKFGALQRLQQAALETDSDDEEDAASAGAGAGASTAHHPVHQQNGFKHPSSSSSKAANLANGTATGVVSAEDDADDSASDAGSEGSASSLVAFDLAEEPGVDAWWGPDGLGLPDGKQLSLRGLAAALRKQDDVNGALEALSRVSCVRHHFRWLYCIVDVPLFLALDCECSRLCRLIEA
jgi:hypothetical protein